MVLQETFAEAIHEWTAKIITAAEPTVEALSCFFQTFEYLAEVATALHCDFRLR